MWQFAGTPGAVAAVVTAVPLLSRQRWRRHRAALLVGVRQSRVCVSVRRACRTPAARGTDHLPRSVYTRTRRVQTRGRRIKQRVKHGKLRARLVTGGPKVINFVVSFRPFTTTTTTTTVRRAAARAHTYIYYYPLRDSPTAVA